MQSTSKTERENNACDGGGGDQQVEQIVVAKIVSKRNVNGEIEYMLKFRPKQAEESEWKAVDDPDCETRVNQEEVVRKTRGRPKKRKSASGVAAERALTNEEHTHAIEKRMSGPTCGRPPQELDDDLYSDSVNELIADVERSLGLKTQRIPERIVGATHLNGQLLYLMKWLGSQETDLLTAKMAKERCPQIVIKYYEDHIEWYSKRKSDDI